jgi:hypothetical protein
LKLRFGLARLNQIRLRPTRDRSARATVVHVLLLSLLMLIQSVTGQSLQLLTFDPINVDGAGNTASTRLRLKNPDKQNQAGCTLSIRDFISANTGRAMGVVATFYDKDNPGSPPTSGRAVGPAVKVQAAANEDFFVKVDFAHMVEAGESKGDLYCDDKPLLPLIAVKQLGLPMKLAVNESPPEKPELTFVKGQLVNVQLRNDDPFTYPFAWDLQVKGKSTQGRGTIGPNDVATIAITPIPEWFSSYQSFLKDEIVDGKLTLRYEPKGAQAADSYPSKSIPIKAKLNDLPPGERDLRAAFVILCVLAFGGILSSYFNVDLVNRLRLVGMKTHLNALAKQTGEMAPQLTSQLRVALLLEHKRVAAEFPRGILFTPETASVLARCATDIDALDVRVTFVAQIADAVARQGRALDASLLAPSLADRIDRDLASAEDLLKKSSLSPPEVQKIQTWIADALSILDNMDIPDPVLEQTLTSRLQDLLAKFIDPVKQDPIFVAIKQQVPVPFILLAQSGAGGSQAERDANSRRLMVVWDLIQMQIQPTPELIGSLHRQDLGSLRNAELLVREAKDEIKPEDLQAAISAKPPQFSIIIDRDVVRVNRASMMRVVFNNPRYNQAAAKRLIDCTWSFGHDNLTERGWEIYHYFPQTQTYQVTVAFRDNNSVEIKQEQPAKRLDVKVQPLYPEGGSHWAIEIQRWLIGFLVAVLGLFAGAKDKIVTLDTLGAIFAVFLLGFAIDMAKNLVVTKQA